MILFLGLASEGSCDRQSIGPTGYYGLDMVVEVIVEATMYGAKGLTVSGCLSRRRRCAT